MADLEALKQALPIEAVVGEYVTLRKAGQTYKGLCPFHNEKTPSFTVSPAHYSYRCFGCGKSGDVVSFIMEMEKLDFKEAVRRLARKAGIELELDRPQPVNPEVEEALAINEAAALFFQSALVSPAGAAARRYLDERGITPATAARFGLGWAPEGWDGLMQYLLKRGYDTAALERSGVVIRHAETGGVYDRFRSRLVFPIRDGKGRLIGFGGRALDDGHPKYLNSPDTVVFHKGQVLYLQDAASDPARKAGVVVVVEGYVDALIAHQAGFDNVVASLGTALTERQLSMLYRTARKVVMALDADPAGQKAVEQTVHLAYQVFGRQLTPHLSAQLARERAPGRYQAHVDMTLHVAELPEGTDPDELIRSNPDHWRRLVAQALPIVEFFFQLITRSSSSEAERRQRANEQLLPVIAEIADPLERGHYIDRLATVLDVSESVIASAVEQVRRRPLPARAFGGGSPARPMAPPATGVGPAGDATVASGADHAAQTGGDVNVGEQAAVAGGTPGDETGSGSPDRTRPGSGFEASAERSRQRYLLSMLLRYPRTIATFAPDLALLRPDDERLGAAWDYVLTHPEARTADDLVDGLEGQEQLTAAFLRALLRETTALPAMEEAAVRRALGDAISLLRSEQLRLAIARCQRQLREATGDELARLLDRLNDMAREKVAMDYNRERMLETSARS